MGLERYEKRSIDMKIRDILKDNSPHVSFEVFPPKTDAGYEGVLSLIHILPESPADRDGGRKRADRRIRRACAGICVQEGSGRESTDAGFAG